MYATILSFTDDDIEWNIRYKNQRLTELPNQRKSHQIKIEHKKRKNLILLQQPQKKSIGDIKHKNHYKI